MKKLLGIFCAILLISACSEKDETKNVEKTKVVEAEQEIPAPALPKSYENQVFSFDVNNLQKGCDKESQIVCAIDMLVKCTINPKFEDCDKTKLPKFIFMEDESLERPTLQTYKIVKMKLIDANTVEIFTEGTCNGNWFGLCQGNIIYVMNLKNNEWVVKDLYALEQY